MRLSGFKLPLERLSATSINMFNTCPEQFRQRYLLKTEEPQSESRFIGTVTHDALKAMFLPEVVDGSTNAPEDAIAYAWDRAINREGEPDWRDLDATEAYRRTSLMLKTYWPIASETKPVKVEERFEEEIGGARVVGFIDLELKDRIREVKTSNAKQSKPKSRHLFQGRLYSLVSDKPVEWHYVTRQATPKIYTPEECPELEMLPFNKDVTVMVIRQAVERMNDLFARYGADRPWPIEGIYGDWSCSYCSFRHNCVAWEVR